MIKIELEKNRKYFMYFMMYAIVGWLYEVFLEVVIYKWGFSNRGILFGPYLPIYGFGALVFILLFYKLSRKKQPLAKKIAVVFVVFLGCAVAATIMELVTSYVLELITGSWPWQTYTDYEYNFQGRIALSPSIRFGLGGVFFIYVLQPIFVKIVDNLSKKTLVTISTVLFIIVFIDFLTRITLLFEVIFSKT